MWGLTICDLRLPPQCIWGLAFLGCYAVLIGSTNQRVTFQKSKVLRSVTVSVPHQILLRCRYKRREKHETCRLHGGNEKCISGE
jgi:hypothetical protein